MTHILGESWDPDGADAGTCPDNYNVEFAREFRYDTARARYLNRELDTEDLMQNPQVYTVVSETWSDYDDDEIHGDFEIESNEAEELRSFEPGIATVDGFASSGSSNTKYYHDDLIGTTRVQSTSSGTTGSAVYTAFGELVSGTNHRYGYAGQWQYQAQDFPATVAIPFLHVGHRYYDPATGRFLQRDPIGIFGGLNSHSYVQSIPTAFVDPEALIGESDLRTDKEVYRKAMETHHRYREWRKANPRPWPSGPPSGKTAHGGMCAGLKRIDKIIDFGINTAKVIGLFLLPGPVTPTYPPKGPHFTGSPG